MTAARPTNTGKTHLAIERLPRAYVGIIGLPLCGRSPARSTTRSWTGSAPNKVGAITGEEKIKPPQPTYYVCTVEAMPPTSRRTSSLSTRLNLQRTASAVHIFTDRLLHARGLSETLLLVPRPCAT